MSLAEKIDADFKAAFKAGDTAKKEVLNLVRSALSNFRISKKKDTLTDDDVMSVLSRELKQRNDSAAEYRKGGAEEQAKAEEAEAAILATYLPAQMSDEDVQKVVDETLKKMNVTDPKEMGKVMGALSKELKGKADLKKVNEIVRQKLSA
jgi:uncharacterized protein YqeY